MPVTTTQRTRLSDVRRRINDMRGQIAAARAQQQASREAFARANTNGGDPTATPEFAAAQRAAQNAESLTDQMGLLQEEERFILGQMAGTDGAGMFGESFLRDPEVLQSLGSMANSTQPIGRINLGVGVARDDLLGMLGQAAGGGAMAAAGEATIGDAGRRGTLYGVAPQLRRPLRLLDLIPSAPMEGRSIEYSQETGSWDTAAETAEGAVKPQHTTDWPDAEAVAKTIAHWTKVRRQQLADTPAMEQVIQARLVYGVLRRLERQIIAGNGLGENLQGILGMTGVGEIAYNAAELAADQALAGLVAVLLSEAMPNVTALHPTDWAAMLRAKAAGSGEYFSGGPFVATAERLWGTVAVPAGGVPVGSALVGDTTLGATVFVREGVNVRASDSDQDDFVRNRVTLLGEGRFALTVWQPSAWCRVRFAA